MAKLNEEHSKGDGKVVGMFKEILGKKEVLRIIKHALGQMSQSTLKTEFCNTNNTGETVWAPPETAV